MDKPANIHNLLLNLYADLGHPAILWQLAVLALALLSAWALNSAINKRVPEREGAWKVGIGGATRIVFPLAALLVVQAGKFALSRWDADHVNLLNVAVPLLGSLALIRLAVYILRHAFAPSSWISASERFISGMVWIGLALHLTGFLPEIIDALDTINFRFGKQRITLLMILAGLLSVAVTMLVALWLGRSLESQIMRAERLNMNLRVVLAKLTRALLIIFGVLIALPAVGIDLTVLSLFGGALGVGLGFGLQKIASNYVSGFIILLDHSIHLGDAITVGERFGTVSRLTARYMVLKSNDGTEAIIPNEILISSIVVNHSYSDRKMRLALPVQISYRSDIDRAMAIMEEAASEHPRVLKEPQPKAHLQAFADSGIDLELDLWINDPEEGQINLRSELNLAIWRAFCKEGIDIPFPQREIRVIGNNEKTGEDK